MLAAHNISHLVNKFLFLYFYVSSPRHCARLPVYFIPTLSGCYQGILAIRTTLGHQMFTLLKGSS